MQMLLTDLYLWGYIEAECKATSTEAKKKKAKAKVRLCYMPGENLSTVDAKHYSVGHPKIAAESLRWWRTSEAIESSAQVIFWKVYEGMEYLNDKHFRSQSLNNIKAGLDEFIVIIMLTELPDQYNPLVMNLDH